MTLRTQSDSRVIGVMSTYNPEAAVALRAYSHLQQLFHLIIVDDGSTRNSIMNRIIDTRITVIKLEENRGIAFALNRGIAKALELNATHILSLDQDSELDPHFVDKQLELFLQASKSTKVGIVLTDCVNEIPSIPAKYSPEGFGLVDEGIQSGMMISASCVNEIGLLDEKLFIDCVDIEYCLRARDNGWNVAIAPETNIKHSLGTLVPKSHSKSDQKSAENTYQYHPPFRRYYITRNNVELILRNITKRPRWVLSVIKRENTPLLNHLIYGPKRFKIFVATVVGLIHGIVGISGKIPKRLSKLIS